MKGVVVAGDGVAGLDLDTIEKRVQEDEAGRWVADLASGKRQWRMRVPADKHDSDVVLMQAVEDRAALVAEVRRLREMLGCEFAATHGCHVDMVGNGIATCCGPEQDGSSELSS